MAFIPSATPVSWQCRIVHLLVRARMRPHAHAPIDPLSVRREMGRPRVARRWMARSTGATMERRTAGHGWPGGEVVSWPGHAPGAPVVLYLHGGGYIACSPETHRPLVSSLVRRVRGRAFVPRYRLAPEHPFPAALDDALAAYRYLLDVERIAPAQIVIAGDSAGGGLALAVVALAGGWWWCMRAAIPRSMCLSSATRSSRKWPAATPARPTPLATSGPSANPTRGSTLSSAASFPIWKPRLADPI